MPTTQQVDVHRVVRLDVVRTLVVDDLHEIKFTPTEYRLVIRLLNCQPVSDRELISLILNEKVENDLWAREALDRHLDNVRRKFKQHRLKIQIGRISGYGYILVSTTRAVEGKLA